MNLYLHGVHIGTLAFDEGVYTFRYAETYEGPALLGLSHREREYQSKVLWPFFQSRIPSLKRPEIRALAEKDGVKTEFDMLCKYGARVAHNQFEMRRLDNERLDQ